MAVVVCVVEKESVPSRDVPRERAGDPEPSGDTLVEVPRKTATCKFFERQIMSQVEGRDISLKFTDPISALPEMLKMAAQITNQE